MFSKTPNHLFFLHSCAKALASQPTCRYLKLSSVFLSNCSPLACSSLTFCKGEGRELIAITSTADPNDICCEVPLCCALPGCPSAADFSDTPGPR